MPACTIDDVLPGLLWLVAVGGSAYLGSYLRTKGQNFATSEDVKGLTRKVEEVKDDFARGLTRLTHDYGLFAKNRNDAYADLYSALQASVEAVHDVVNPPRNFDEYAADDLFELADAEHVREADREEYYQQLDDPDRAVVLRAAANMYITVHARRASGLQKVFQSAVLRHALYLRGEIRILATELGENASLMEDALTRFGPPGDPLARVARTLALSIAQADRMVDLMMAEMEGKAADPEQKA